MLWKVNYSDIVFMNTVCRYCWPQTSWNGSEIWCRGVHCGRVGVDSMATPVRAKFLRHWCCLSPLRGEPPPPSPIRPSDSSMYRRLPCGKYNVSNNVPLLAWYNLYIHRSIATNVAKKVGSQNVLYFPTLPNYCFCSTWQNRKPGNCVFWLKYCMLSYQKNTKHS